LGDLLLQVVFHAEIAREAGRFSVADVATAITDKLVRRHPHVFADVVVRDADEVIRNWKQIKATERGAPVGGPLGRLEAVSRSLPALVRADEIGKKARDVGFDWPDLTGVRAKVQEELAEVDEALASGDRAAAQRELGDLLLATASLARHLEISPELALRDATERFLGRVRRCAKLATADGRSLESLDDPERDRLWERAKATEP